MTKYKVCVLLTFLITLCSLMLTKNEETLFGKIIYIDPGHGGIDPGAVYKEMKESDINLEISKQLKEELEKHGAKVYLTRIGDYDLSENNTQNHKRNDLTVRARIINESMCDMYISIHLNSDASPTWSGAQIFYTNKNEKNKKIAHVFEKEFKNKLKTKREAKPIKNMYLFEKIERPGILVEAGFISNPNDRYLLKDKTYQKKLVTTIQESIIKYFKK